MIGLHPNHKLLVYAQPRRQHHHNMLTVSTSIFLPPPPGAYSDECSQSQSAPGGGPPLYMLTGSPSKFQTSSTCWVHPVHSDSAPHRFGTTQIEEALQEPGRPSMRQCRIAAWHAWHGMPVLRMMRRRQKKQDPQNAHVCGQGT